jgi:hypothetical protein
MLIDPQTVRQSDPKLEHLLVQRFLELGHIHVYLPQTLPELLQR